MVRIFISHNSEDSAIAELLADLFHTALHLSKTEIRCTSVDGYRLPVGANTDEQLRREVLEASVLVGLISHHSFESAYVLFELGARWGKNAFIAPVLAPGVSPSILKGPLSGLNALSCESMSQIHQLISDIASQLETSIEPTATFQGNVEAIVNFAPGENHIVKKQAFNANAPQRGKTDKSREENYSDAEDIIERHCKSQWEDDFSMRVFCEEQQRRAVENLRIRSLEGIPSEVFEQIRAQAANMWPEDFEMRLHTENQQIEAYQKLQNP
jgi:hypothetical protein